jgi:hypothetical protein
MRNTLMLGVVALAMTLTFTYALERDASACGGCFITPGENPTVVTDHRMILSIAKDQSTLYDQIKYTGSPASFAWVLPISGTVEVGISSDSVFQAFSAFTTTSILPPPLNCPAPPSCGFSSGSSGTNGSEGGRPKPGDDEEVIVLKQENLGPYKTVQLRATDPDALKLWLAQNGFGVPADVQPVVDKYVTEKFDFLALKLLPGKDVQDMRPVRVTTKGTTVVLPLRMVAAGTGPVVGISLWVVAEGRYEPQNYPSFTIPTSDIAWDWTLSRSNYTDIRAQKTAAAQGRAWETESSIVLQSGQLESQIILDYVPVEEPPGTVVKTAVQVRSEDVAALFHGIPTANVRVTRMRADLAHAALNSDLVITASPDQALLSNVRQLTKELSQPLCPVYQGCVFVGTAPRDEAAARSTGNEGTETFSCAVGTTSSSPIWIGVGLGCAAFAIARARRRRAE